MKLGVFRHTCKLSQGVGPVKATAPSGSFHQGWEGGGGWQNTLQAACKGSKLSPADNVKATIVNVHAARLNSGSPFGKMNTLHSCFRYLLKWDTLSY